MTVYIVGAGPGNPMLITLRGMELVKKAEVILYDRLVNPELLQYAPSSCLMVHTDGHATFEDTKALLLTHGRAHKTVVRLKNGDPMVCSTGAKEIDALREHGIPYEIVPGVSSAVAGPAYAGIPVTHADRHPIVSLVHSDEVDWEGLSSGDLPRNGTLVVLLGAIEFSTVSEALIRCGFDPDTPVAATHRSTTPEQQTVTGTLSSLMNAPLDASSIVVIGAIATLHRKLAWYEDKCQVLVGKKVLVMRTEEQFNEAGKLLNQWGAVALNGGTMRVETLEWDTSMLERADVVVVTSPMAVKAACARAFLPSAPTYIAVGPSTKAALGEEGINALIPSEYTLEGLISFIKANVDPSAHSLVLQSRGASPILTRALEGYDLTPVPIYDIGFPTIDWDAVMSADIVFFTSTLMVNEVAGHVSHGAVKVSIGPQTSAALNAKGISVDIEAPQSTIASMINATFDYLY
ncbi:uroporphyrinogen-III C-methyltransferase [archaeon]|nr:MAG: uroporphyrinogen-III C-methyltransferase [archaeon]